MSDTQKTKANPKEGTLAYHRKIAAAAFQEDSKAVEFLDKMITEAENGENEMVVMSEPSLIQILGGLHFGTIEDIPDEVLDMIRKKGS